MSEESIQNPPGSDHNVRPTLINFYPLPVANFGGSCVINNNTSAYTKLINLYISCKLYT